MTDAFQTATYGARPVGFGTRPAVLVVDFQRGFTDPEFTMGKSERIHQARDRTVALLEKARQCDVPVASCYVGWQSHKDMQYWKVDALYEEFLEGSPALDIDPAIVGSGDDYTFMKNAPSMFFQTPITTFLTKHGIDTTIITGCVTSGCVRATTIDAFSYGYRTIVVDDCCGDPAKDSHEANLRDVDRRYADVVMSRDVVGYFEELRGRNDT